MQIDGVECDYEECAVALDRSHVWANGVKYVQAGEVPAYLQTILAEQQLTNWLLTGRKAERG